MPQRGEKRGLVDLANRNAALAYQTRFNQAHGGAVRRARDAAARCSALPALPRRIECFDISTIQGSETVASMVVCEDGRMRRGDYRKFRIRAELALGGLGRGSEPAPDPGRSLCPSPDDFAAMHEVVLPALPQAARAGRTVSRSRS